MTNCIDKVTKAVLVEGLATQYTAGTFIPEHSHDLHQIAHAISGAMRVGVSDATWIVPSGRALWIPANMPHSIRCSGHVAMRTVYLSGDLAPVRTSVAVIGVSPLMREVLVRLSEGCAEQLTTHLLPLLLIEMAAMDEKHLQLLTPKDARIARLVAVMLEQPADQTTLGVWAKRLGFSERNLIRYIRSETGMSFRELRRQIRVIAAIEKLSDGQSVTNVALDAGFETPSAFIHAFRLITGVTPGKYIA